MNVHLQKIGKKFGRSWIFRNVDYTFNSGESYAILGSNGSGKSTLLQILSGFLIPSAGTISYQKNNSIFQPESFYRYISLATPYLDIPEEFTLMEMLGFHEKFKTPLVPVANIPEVIQLDREKEKQIRNFSSGMRQRLRLGLALLFESEVILLDEPTSHLDANSIAWYDRLISDFANKRTLIISSNEEKEYVFCRHHLLVENFK